MPDEEPTKEDVKELSLEDLSLAELKDLAKEKGIKGYSKMSKEELLEELNK